jgi:signal transduction histidine kinase
LPPWPITAEVRHNVFLAFKEALHNVVKHAGATEVSIVLKTDDHGFTLAVRDDGRGFDARAAGSDSPPQSSGRGNGLKNIRQRLQKIAGCSEIHSTAGAGTEIKFSVHVARSSKTV